MPKIPRDPLPESTLALIRDPYRFISKRCERYQSDLFETALMFQRTPRPPLPGRVDRRRAHGRRTASLPSASPMKCRRRI